MSRSARRPMKTAFSKSSSTRKFPKRQSRGELRSTAAHRPGSSIEGRKMRGLLGARRIPCAFILDDFMRPADAFAHPQDVLRDADLTINEKRSILAAWASDA